MRTSSNLQTSHFPRSMLLSARWIPTSFGSLLNFGIYNVLPVRSTIHGHGGMGELREVTTQIVYLSREILKHFPHGIRNPSSSHRIKRELRLLQTAYITNVTNVFLDLCFWNERLWKNKWYRNNIWESVDFGFHFMINMYAHSNIDYCVYINKKTDVVKHVRSSVGRNLRGKCIPRNTFWKEDILKYQNSSP